VARLMGEIPGRGRDVGRRALIRPGGASCGRYPARPLDAPLAPRSVPAPALSVGWWRSAAASRVGERERRRLRRARGRGGAAAIRRQEQQQVEREAVSMSRQPEVLATNRPAITAICTRGIGAGVAIRTGVSRHSGPRTRALRGRRGRAGTALLVGVRAYKAAQRQRSVDVAILGVFTAGCPRRRCTGYRRQQRLRLERRATPSARMWRGWSPGVGGEADPPTLVGLRGPDWGSPQRGA